MREWSELTDEERNEIRLAYAVMPEREADLYAAQIHEGGEDDYDHSEATCQRKP